MKNHYYHIALSLKGRLCSIIGFGEVGQRKLHGLIQSDAEQIEVFDPNLQTIMYDRPVTDCAVIYHERTCTDDDLARSDLVFACTDSKDENRRIAVFCRAHGILCNATSTPEDGSFYVPSTIRRGGLTATLGTDGQSPALTRVWARELDQWLAGRGTMLTFMALVRRHVLSLNQASGENRRLFRALAEGPLQDCVLGGDRQQAEGLLRELLPSALMVHMENYMAVLFSEDKDRAGSAG